MTSIIQSPISMAHPPKNFQVLLPVIKIKNIFMTQIIKFVKKKYFVIKIQQIF